MLLLASGLATWGAAALYLRTTDDYGADLAQADQVFWLKYFLSSQSAILWMSVLFFMSTVFYWIGLLSRSATGTKLGSRIAWVAIAMALGVALVWLVERSDLPARNTVFALALLPIAVPGMVKALGWSMLGNPNNGILNLMARNLFDLDIDRGPLNVYSLGGIIFVSALSHVPSVALMIAGAFRNFDPVMEEASEQPARMSGIRTVFSGFSTFAVSAMKCTPAWTITSAFTLVASRASWSESPTKSATQL